MAGDLPFLPSEWIDSARSKAANLGMNSDLTALSPEHWEIVLHNVDETMRLHRVDLPDGWREALTEQAGRNDARHDGPES